MPDPKIITVINQHGFEDFVFEDQPNMPVCSCCNAFIHLNKGQGTLCSTCDQELTVEYEHDNEIEVVVNS